MSPVEAAAVTAPVAADNQTVSVWALGVLVIAVGLLARAIWNKMESNEAKCEARANALQMKIEEEVKYSREVTTKALQNNVTAFSSLVRAMRDREFIPDSHHTDESDLDLRRKLEDL